jgi:GntR family transcriptional regulator
VIHLRRLASIEREPVTLLESWLPADRFAGLLRVRGLDAGRSLWATLEEEFGVTLGRSRSGVEIARLTDEQADLLLQPVGTPSLLLTGVAEDLDGTPVELSHTYYRADRFRFTVTSYRNRSEGAGGGAR